MDWKGLEGKQVFIRTNSEKVYNGKVIDVDVGGCPPLIWITILDKFGEKITFVHSEIKMIKEEA